MLHLIAYDHRKQNIQCVQRRVRQIPVPAELTIRASLKLRAKKPVPGTSPRALR